MHARKNTRLTAIAKGKIPQNFSTRYPTSLSYKQQLFHLSLFSISNISLIISFSRENCEDVAWNVNRFSFTRKTLCEYGESPQMPNSKFTFRHTQLLSELARRSPNFLATREKIKRNFSSLLSLLMGGYKLKWKWKWVLSYRRNGVCVCSFAYRSRFTEFFIFLLAKCGNWKRTRVIFAMKYEDFIE